MGRHEETSKGTTICSDGLSRTGFGLCLPRPARESREGETAEQKREKGIAWLERVTHTVWRHEVVANTQEAKDQRKKKRCRWWSVCWSIRRRGSATETPGSASAALNLRTERSSAGLRTGEQPFDRRGGEAGESKGCCGAAAGSKVPLLESGHHRAGVERAWQGRRPPRDKAPGGKLKSGVQCKLGRLGRDARARVNRRRKPSEV